MSFSVSGSFPKEVTAKPRFFESRVLQVSDKDGNTKPYVEWFAHPSRNDLDDILDKYKDTLYGGDGSENYTYAVYCLFKCSETGERQFTSFTQEKEILAEIENIQQVDGLNSHIAHAVQFILYGRVVVAEDLLSSVEGSIEHAKK